MHIVDKLLLLITQFVEAHQRLELGTKVVSFGYVESGCVLIGSYICGLQVRLGMNFAGSVLTVWRIDEDWRFWQSVPIFIQFGYIIIGRVWNVWIISRYIRYIRILTNKYLIFIETAIIITLITSKLKTIILQICTWTSYY